jgi:hypothetical protein
VKWFVSRPKSACYRSPPRDKVGGYGPSPNGSDGRLIKPNADLGTARPAIFFKLQLTPSTRSDVAGGEIGSSKGVHTASLVCWKIEDAFGDDLGASVI